MSTKSHTINRDLAVQVAAPVLAAQLAGQRDPHAIDDAHLDKLADLSVRAALALDAALPRAEERLAAEAKAAEEAQKAAELAEAAAAKASKEQATSDKKHAAHA